MATQTRISNWVDTVSQSTQPGSQFSHPPSDHRHRSRPPYSQQPSHSQHSRSNSASRSNSHEPHHYRREPTRQRSHSHSSSRPQGSRSYSYSQPVHSRTYAYAMNYPPPPVPIAVPPPVPLPHPVPRRSRTLPPQPHNVVYHTYDPQPRGTASYVMLPQVYGGAPQQMRMQSSVRILFSFLSLPNTVALTRMFFVIFFLFGRSRRRNGRSRYSSAYLQALDPGALPLRAPHQSPSIHLKGGTGEGVVTEVAVFGPLPVRCHFLFLAELIDFAWTPPKLSSSLPLLLRFSTCFVPFPHA